MRPLPWAACAALALAGGAAAAQECRLALVLALDVSSSVNEQEDRLQREGLAKALTEARVLEAILSGDPVALYVFEWSGRSAQAAILDGWQLLVDEADVVRVATAIAKSRRSHADLPTALGAALGHAATQLRDAPACRARTIDVAGDGINNESFGPALAYDTFPFEGVTVNALVIGDLSATQAGREEGAQLVAWFQTEVLRGPGAFSVVAEGYGDYARAMAAKLLRELELPAVSGTYPDHAG